jgi:hypothetical protein
LHLGDENSHYFHLCAYARLWKNQIKVLDDSDGNSIFSHDAKAQLLHGFYKNLLGIPRSSEDCLDLPSLVSSTSLDSFQASALIQPFSMDELRTAVLSMNSNSSPGLDGFGPAFYKKYWDLVKHSLFESLQDFHSLTTDIRPINKSFIVLLPKKVGGK